MECSAQLCACHALAKHALIPALQMVKMTSEISVIATTGLVLTQSTCQVKIGFTKYLNLYDVSYDILILIWPNLNLTLNQGNYIKRGFFISKNHIYEVLHIALGVFHEKLCLPYK